MTLDSIRNSCDVFKISFHPNGYDDEDDYPDGEEDEDDEQEGELCRDDVPVCYSSPVQCSWYSMGELAGLMVQCSGSLFQGAEKVKKKPITQLLYLAFPAAVVDSGERFIETGTLMINMIIIHMTGISNLYHYQLFSNIC